MARPREANSRLAPWNDAPRHPIRVDAGVATNPVAERRFLVLDCRISASVIAPYQHEIIAVNTR